MDSEAIVPALFEQIPQTKARAKAARARGADGSLIDAVGRSLRWTLSSIAKSQDPRDWPFTVLVNSEGDLVACHRGRVLPTSKDYLLNLFREAGVRLRPGQLILLDAMLARAVVEKALGILSWIQAEHRSAKARLLRATIELDSERSEISTGGAA